MKILLNIINGILESKGEKKIQEIKKNFNLRDDLGLDSIDLAELTVRIEDKYTLYLIIF